MYLHWAPVTCPIPSVPSLPPSSHPLPCRLMCPTSPCTQSRADHAPLHLGTCCCLCGGGGGFPCSLLPSPPSPCSPHLLPGLLSPVQLSLSDLLCYLLVRFAGQLSSHVPPTQQRVPAARTRPSWSNRCQHCASSSPGATQPERLTHLEVPSLDTLCYSHQSHVSHPGKAQPPPPTAGKEETLRPVGAGHSSPRQPSPY